MSVEPIDDTNNDVHYLPGHLPEALADLGLNERIFAADKAIATTDDIGELVGQHVGLTDLMKELRLLTDGIAGRVAALTGVADSRTKTTIDTPYGQFVVAQKAAKSTTDWERVLNAMERAAVVDPDTGEAPTPEAVATARRFREAVVASMSTAPSTAPKSGVSAYIPKNEVVTKEWTGGYDIRPR